MRGKIAVVIGVVFAFIGWMGVVTPAYAVKTRKITLEVGNAAWGVYNPTCSYYGTDNTTVALGKKKLCFGGPMGNYLDGTTIDYSIPVGVRLIVTWNNNWREWTCVFNIREKSIDVQAGSRCGGGTDRATIAVCTQRLLEGCHQIGL